MSIKTCPNCGRQFESQFDWPKTCSSECERAWTAKRVTAAATMATALELQKQTKMMQEAQARAEAQAQEAAMAEIAEKKAVADEAAKKCGFSSAEEVLYWQKQAGPGADIEAAIKAKKEHEEYEKWHTEHVKETLKNRENAAKENQKLLSEEDKVRYSELVKLCEKSKYCDEDKELWRIVLIVLFPIAVLILRNFIPFLHHYRILFTIFVSLGISLTFDCLSQIGKLNNLVKKIRKIKTGSNSPFLYINPRALGLTCTWAHTCSCFIYAGVALIVLPIMSRMIRSTFFNVISVIVVITLFIITLILFNDRHLEKFCAKHAYDKLGQFIGDYDEFYDWIEGKIDPCRYKECPRTKLNFLPIEKDDEFIKKYGYLTRSNILYRRVFEENNNEKLDWKTVQAIKNFHKALNGDFSGFEIPGVFNNFFFNFPYSDYHEFINYYLGKNYEDIGDYAKTEITKYKKKYAVLDDKAKKMYLDIQAKYKNKAEKIMEKYEKRPINEHNKRECHRLIKNIVSGCHYAMERKSLKFYVI